MAKLKFGFRSCRFCACTEDRACQGGCAWISKEHNVCTTCAFDRLPDLTPEERAVAVRVLYNVDPTPAPPDKQWISNKWR